MPELIQGKDLIAFFRRVKDQQSQDAGKIRFQTEHSVKMEKENESTSTKDGNVNTITDGENSAEFTSLAYREDGETINMYKELKKWFKDGEKVEFWQVDVASGRMDTQTSKMIYDVEYFQGYFKSFEISAPSDDKVEVSYEYVIDGKGIEHTDSLTESQQQAVDALQYTYHTLAKETTPAG